ncbi:hypothetical protein KKF23_01725 [Patescibacteria group bacterium]|nr:hypothetical protein [Patescibacteria group bacterium]
MEILGYILYAILLFITVVWMFGVRKKADVLYPTVLSSLYFLITSIVLPLYNINLLHILWIGPLIYILAITLNPLLLTNIPLISNLLRLICNIYVSIVRVGVDKNKMEQERQRLNKEFVDNHFKK